MLGKHNAKKIIIISVITMLVFVPSFYVARASVYADILNKILNILKQITSDSNFFLADLSGSLTSVLPTLPETFNVPYQLPTGGQTWTPVTGSEFQTALNSAALGDVIVLTAGTTYTTDSNFTLPDKTSGSGWIYIVSSEMAQLPSEGTRVAPSDASHMPKITDASGGRPIVSKTSAHHYRFAGIEISTGNVSTTLIMLGQKDDGSYATTIAELPSHITFDRCYIHSASDTNSARVGINADGRYIAVVDSYISNFKDSSDAQAILTWNGAGPLKIVNNYLESTGENFMSGGGEPQITHTTDPTDYPDADTGSVPSDIEIRGNYFYKPNIWNQFSSEYAGHDWTIKNILELKNSQRILIEGNVFDNCWPDVQSGRAIVIKSSGSTVWTKGWDITFQNNIVRNATGGIDLVTNEPGMPNAGLKRILIKNNLVDLTSADSWVGTSFMFAFSCGSVFATDVTADHNTMLGKVDVSTAVVFGNTGDAFDRVDFTNNILRYGKYGVKGDNTEAGASSLDYYLVNYSFTKNLFVDLNSLDGYPGNNFNVNNINGVGFTDYVSGNYSLATSSLYHSAGTDGKDLGPDWDILTASTASTITGGAVYASPSPCTSFTYLDWGACQSNSTRIRTVASSSPSGCIGGTPVLSESCTYTSTSSGGGSSSTITATTTTTATKLPSTTPPAIDDSAQITVLLAKIAQLKAQTGQLIAQRSSKLPSNFKFTILLKQGQSSIDVKYLQIFLNSDPDTRVANTGPGSLGYETRYFGQATKQALIKFQIKYAINYLKDRLSTTDGIGVTGPKTREKLNQLLGK